MSKKIENLSNEEYHAHRAIGSSDLAKIHRSVSYYMHHKSRPSKKTKALITGSLLHTMVLEPHLTLSEFVIEPEKVLKKDVGAELYEIYKQALKNLETTTKTVVKKDVYDLVENMAASVLSSELMQSIIKKGKIEESYFWIDAETGIECKCRPDIFIEEMGLIIDLKSTDDLTIENWEKTISKWSYDRQAAHYMNGVEAVTGVRPKGFIHAVVDKDEPHDFIFAQLNESALEVGEQLVRKDLRKYAESLKTGVMTLPKEIVQVGLPAWGYDVERR